MTPEPAKLTTCIITVKPRAPLAEMTAALSQGDLAKGTKLAEALDPLFKIVTVKIMEEYEGFQVPCKFRNPSAIKTLIRGLGMPAGPCRPPLGRMTPKATAVVRAAIRTVYEKNRELLIPLQDFYRIDPEERVARDEHWL